MAIRSELAIEIVTILKRTIGFKPAALHEPIFDGNEYAYINDCLESTHVSSTGDYIDNFESALANYTGAKYAISMVNGTSALQLALILSGVRAGDEVLVPALTFIATANAVSYLGAIPHFVDSEFQTLGIDATKLRDYLIQNTEVESDVCVNKITRRIIRALVPMHTFGHPSNLEELISIAKEFCLVIVEDAAESLGSFYLGQHTGTFGLLGILSFNGNKIITTGGGGAILTNDEVLAKRAKHLSTTARISHEWEFQHDQIGFNFRMPNLNAALGLAQLEKLSDKLNLKRKLFQKYKLAFESIPEVKIFEEPLNCSSNYWLQTLVLSEENINFRDLLLKECFKVNIRARPAWRPLCDLAPYSVSPAMDLKGARSIYSRIINIPSSPNLVANI